MSVCMKRVVFGITLLLTVSGHAQSSICQTYHWYPPSTCRAYPGKALPKQDVAVLKLKNIAVNSVNGKDAVICNAGFFGSKIHECDIARSIELLPGVYRIGFAPVVGLLQTGTYKEPQFRALTVEAGKTYTAVGTYSITNCTQRTCTGTWGVEVGAADAK